jgi:hypothetical protein
MVLMREKDIRSDLKVFVDSRVMLGLETKLKWIVCGRYTSGDSNV